MIVELDGFLVFECFSKGFLGDTKDDWVLDGSLITLGEDLDGTGTAAVLPYFEAELWMKSDGK